MIPLLLMSVMPEVQAAFIMSLGTVLSTVIGSATAALIGQRILNQEKLQRDLKTAISDIEFLLLVEREHCDENKLQQGSSNFQRVRNKVRSIQPWSGKFTPGRARDIHGMGS